MFASSEPEAAFSLNGKVASRRLSGRAPGLRFDSIGVSGGSLGNAHANADADAAADNRRFSLYPLSERGGNGARF